MADQNLVGRFILGDAAWALDAEYTEKEVTGRIVRVEPSTYNYNYVISWDGGEVMPALGYVLESLLEAGVMCRVLLGRYVLANRPVFGWCVGMIYVVWSDGTADVAFADYDSLLLRDCDYHLLDPEEPADRAEIAAFLLLHPDFDSRAILRKFPGVKY
jgi:hypothetical protein